MPAKPEARHESKAPVDLNLHLIPDPVKEVLDQLEKRLRYSKKGRLI
jgi:hypothetical protein